MLSAIVGGVGAAAWTHPEIAKKLLFSFIGGKATEAKISAPDALAPAVSDKGILTLTEKAMDGMGIEAVAVRPQVEPIRLDLLGTTEYDSENQTRIRPLFKGRVDKVHARVGDYIKKGDPLIEFYSTELADAKNSCEIERIQWVYDNNLLKAREELLKSNSISQQLYLETKNNEMKSLREFEVARDKLLVYGLTEEEVARVKDEVGSQKARMTFRSPATGIVISRDVVPGNLYDDDDTLLVIEPLDHLWVWGNVFESDLDLVKLGQSWEIQFPFQAERLHGTVDYISNNVDPGTHAVRIRTSIKNPEGKLKSQMLVRGTLEVPPVPGRTVIPRTALVTNAGKFYTYVKEPGASNEFRRVPVTIAQEKGDQVVVDTGLTPGEKVVNVGALILDQMFDNARVTRLASLAPEDTLAKPAPAEARESETARADVLPGARVGIH